MMRTFTYTGSEDTAVFTRSTAVRDVSAPVREILEDVRKNGDDALRRYTEKFDKVHVENFEVTEEQMEEGLSRIDSRFYDILTQAAENIEQFHRHQLSDGFAVTTSQGVVLGQRVLPIERVGFYVPNGTAAYPSTLLMNCIPAKIAGCPLLEIVTPPGKDGKVNPAILAAAKIAGVDRIFTVGGAQAIGALAYGTQTIPKVYKITGPGNAYVAEAKKQVFGKVGIDTIAGPSEVLIVADESADPVMTASDLLAQAEHDRMAEAVLVTCCEDLAEETDREVARQLEKLPRREIAETSLLNNGKIIITRTLDQAVDIANEAAPEHLELLVEKPFEVLGKIKNAGSVFLGPYSPVALGDYMAGPNHTLPTMGTAWFESPLSVDDFVKKSQYTYYSREALSGLSQSIEYFAHQEGLDGHAESIRKRFS